METFVIRAWTPAERGDDPQLFRLRGLVEHVGSGESGAFRGGDELLVFLEGRLGADTQELEQGVNASPGHTTRARQTTGKGNPMRRLFRKRPSAALIIACAALAVALSGVGYAATVLPKNSVGSKQVINGSLKKADLSKKAVAALKGARGQQGARGEQGLPGIQGVRGDKGDPGPAGPFPDTLPGGKTIRGYWGWYSTVTASGQFAGDFQSFGGFTLAAPPTAHYVAFNASPPSQCPGTLSNPQAAPGNLCVYESVRGNLAQPQVCNMNFCPASGPAGFAVYSTSLASGVTFARGTWAVTAA